MQGSTTEYTAAGHKITNRFPSYRLVGGLPFLTAEILSLTAALIVELAFLDHNSNTQHEQATTKSGKLITLYMCDLS